MKSNKHRILVLAALPLTAVLAGGVALAATGSQPAASPTGTVATVPTQQSTAPTCQQDQARDRDRDGSCLQSPSSVPGTMMHRAHGNCGEPDDQSGDE
jgi:hypothetical protein